MSKFSSQLSFFSEIIRFPLHLRIISGVAGKHDSLKKVLALKTNEKYRLFI